MVLADDTTLVIVNGTTILAANPNGSNSICSSAPIGCLSRTERVFGLCQPAPYLEVGANTITFTVYPTAGDGYGVDYSGSFTTSTVPERATLILLTAGLVGVAFVGRRTVFN